MFCHWRLKTGYRIPSFDISGVDGYPSNVQNFAKVSFLNSPNGSATTRFSTRTIGHVDATLHGQCRQRWISPLGGYEVERSSSIDRDTNKRELNSEDESLRKRQDSNQRMHRLRYHVLVGNGGCCHREGGEHLLQMLRREVTRLNGDHIRITKRDAQGGVWIRARVLYIHRAFGIGTLHKDLFMLLSKVHLFRGEIQQELVSYTYRLQNFIQH